jgi:hypothetical protein
VAPTPDTVAAEVSLEVSPLLGAILANIQRLAWQQQRAGPSRRTSRSLDDKTSFQFLSALSFPLAILPKEVTTDNSWIVVNDGLGTAGASFDICTRDLLFHSCSTSYEG